MSLDSNIKTHIKDTQVAAKRLNCTPTFKRFTEDEIIKFNKIIKLTEGYSLFHSYCEGCGKYLKVAVKDDTVPKAQKCGWCKDIDTGNWPVKDDIELYNLYCNHNLKMIDFLETCKP